jgi:GNAT superfamily N-acetyltransferase
MESRANFKVRIATIDDLDYLVRHRCEMFTDMGSLAPPAYQNLAKETRKYLSRALKTGEYVAWVAMPADEPQSVIAGAGVQLRQVLPRPHKDGSALPTGIQALVLNVYTEKEWRRTGLAEILVREILKWCKENHINSIALHASEMGRPIYERIGFVQTNEMRYEGEL